jgi:hypothetical protein
MTLWRRRDAGSLALVKRGWVMERVSRSVVLGLTVILPAVSASAATAPQRTEARRLVASVARLPLRFEPNLGQTDPRVRFLARGPGYNLFLTPDETVLVL